MPNWRLTAASPYSHAPDPSRPCNADRAGMIPGRTIANECGPASTNLKILPIINPTLIVGENLVDENPPKGFMFAIARRTTIRVGASRKPRHPPFHARERL